MRIIASQRYVYFANIANTPIVKIGVADYPDQRLREIQVGCPCKIEIIGWIKCHSRTVFLLERSLHAKFNKYRCLGEWFILDRPQIDEVLHCISKRKQILWREDEWRSYAETCKDFIDRQPTETARRFIMGMLNAPVTDVSLVGNAEEPLSENAAPVCETV
jgi:hypothetical protein